MVVTLQHVPTSGELVIGNQYYDEIAHKLYVWDGVKWTSIVDETVRPFVVPTDEQLKTHPSLASAWEELLVIQRILGL